MIRGARSNQAGAHAVGAAVLLAPHRAEHQTGAECGIAEAQVAVIIEQHPIMVGQDDGVTGTGKLMVQVRHFSVGEGDELEVQSPSGQDALRAATRTARAATAGRDGTDSGSGPTNA